MVKKAAHATPNQLLRAARKERGWTQQQVADRIRAPLSLNVSRWENGTAFPSAYYLEKLCQVFGKSIHELGLSQVESGMQGEQVSHPEPPFEQRHSQGVPKAGEQDGIPSQLAPKMEMLPYPRNLFFLGREEVLIQLQRQATALSQPQAICGLGGVGKTQVALEYAYRYAQDYQAIFWARADSRDALVEGFLEIAHTVQLPERGERDQGVVVAAVKGWLSQQTGWLLILDNADELGLLLEFLPVPIKGHILLTTCAQALGGLASRIEIETLDLDTASLLLLRRAGLLTFDAPLAQAEQADRQAAREISQELGCLPLALDQAGAYLEETRCSLQHYLDLYRGHRANLLRYRGGVVLDHPDSIATTWSLSFALVEQRSTLAADLLRLCALLHPDAIPEEIFLQAAAHLGPALTAMETDPLAFNKALAVVQSYSLLRRNGHEQTLSIHRLVQAVFQDAMTEQERNQWVGRAIAALDTVFPAVRDQGWEHWKQCGRLLPQALTIVAGTVPQAHSLALASLLTKIADYLLQRAQYQQAEPLYQRALSLYEQMLGNGHPQVAFPLNGLADLSRKQVQHEQAEQLYQRALRLGEQEVGLEHPHVPHSLAGLAELYRSQGKYAEAEPLYQRALCRWEQRLGPEHPHVATLLNGLANLYLDQGKYAEAESLYQRALRIWEEQAGQQAPMMAYPFNGLAALYSTQGKYAKAETLYQQALRISEQQLGPEHPDVGYPLNNLADLYREQGRYAEAEPLLQRARRIWEQRLGPEHPLLAHPVNRLALLCQEQGKYAEAELLFQQALRIREQGQGPQHPDTAETMHDLARCQEAQGNSLEARIWYARALAIREQVFGADHPQTTQTRNCLIVLLHAMGQQKEAAQLEAAQSKL